MLLKQQKKLNRPAFCRLASIVRTATKAVIFKPRMCKGHEPIIVSKARETERLLVKSPDSALVGQLEDIVDEVP